MEYWSKTHNLCVRINGFGINYLAHIFKDNPDPVGNPLLVLGYKFYPMGSQYGRNMVTDMRCGAEYNPYLD